MNNNLLQLLKVNEGRQLNPSDADLFVRYYTGIPQRLKAMQNLEQQEADTIQQAQQQFFVQHPEMLSFAGAKEKTIRDMTYLYRTATMSMVQQDLSRLAEKAGFIFAIFEQLGFPEQAIENAYEILRQVCAERVSPETWQLAEPYFKTLSVLRLKQWQDLQNHQHAIIETVTAHVLKTWPGVSALNSPEDNLRKDMLSLFQAVGESLISQSLTPVEERKAWLYNFFKTQRFDMQSIFDTYRQLPELAAQHLQSDTVAGMKIGFEALSRP
ncbi:MAG: hypothetical protein IGS03_14165 [Candidatus Sericytochromatia bacterium]|nr:hypothetical protein [Candidatus Sericytochromatia bacterium]